MPMANLRNQRYVSRLLQAARGIYRPDVKFKQPQPTQSLLRGQASLKPKRTRHHPVNVGFPLRCFSLTLEHFGTFNTNKGGRSKCWEDRGEEDSSAISQNQHATATPEDFHSELVHRIRTAKKRVKIATLYVGAAGTGATKAPRETEFLDAIEETARKCCSEGLEFSLLMDANRGSRRVKRVACLDNSSGINANSSGTTSSADAVFERLQRGIRGDIYPSPLCDNLDDNVKCGVYLFCALDEPLRSILPSPLNELAGVMHIKAYVIDDALILSGANLSEEYFTDRQDRYMLFTNGGAGLVDFYADLIDVLCRYSHRYDGDPTIQLGSSTSKDTKRELYNSLSALFDGTSDERSSDDDVIAFAVPTFQSPQSFFSVSESNKLPFLSDTEVTDCLLRTALEKDSSTSVGISSAYLNPTPQLMHSLKQFGDSKGKKASVVLLTAGPKSHGFAAPKSKDDSVNGSGRDWIPSAYAELVNEAAEHLYPRGGKVLLYERDGWSFHAKGLWLSSSAESGGDSNFGQDNSIRDSTALSATIVGSGNYGVRSQDLDFESNCILIFNQSESSGTSLGKIKSRVADEWNEMASQTSEVCLVSGTEPPAGLGMKAALGLIRKVM